MRAILAQFGLSDGMEMRHLLSAIRGKKKTTRVRQIVGNLSCLDSPGRLPRIPGPWQHSFGAKLLISPDKLPVSVVASSILKNKGAERHRPVAPSGADLKQPHDDIANTRGRAVLVSQLPRSSRARTRTS